MNVAEITKSLLPEIVFLCTQKRKTYRTPNITTAKSIAIIQRRSLETLGNPLGLGKFQSDQPARSPQMMVKRIRECGILPKCRKKSGLGIRAKFA